MDKNKTVNKVSLFIVTWNILLTVFKFSAGFFGNSSAMISDAIHSFSDVVATFIAWIGAIISLKKPELEKTEYIASMLLGFILLCTSLFIGISGIKGIISREKSSPDIIAFIMAVVSVTVKEIMYRYTMHYAKTLNSCVFKAEAWHQRSDALASLGTLIGIGAAMLGFPVFESVACILISLFVFKIAYGIIKDSTIKLSDNSCRKEYSKTE